MMRHLEGERIEVEAELRGEERRGGEGAETGGEELRQRPARHEPHGPELAAELGGRGAGALQHQLRLLHLLLQGSVREAPREKSALIGDIVRKGGGSPHSVSFGGTF